MLINLASYLCIGSGAFVILLGSYGLLRMPDLFTRLHATSVVDSLGCMLIVAGLLLQSGWQAESVKLLLMLGFILLTSPTATHVLGKLAWQEKHQRQL